MPSVCVVGAGALGLASALELARRGAGEVRVLEARHVAAGSSGLSVGIVETQYVRPLDIELRVRAMARFAELEHRHGLRIVRNGYLRLAHGAQEMVAFARSVEVQRALGVTDACALDRAGVARLVPDMAVADLAGGLYGPSDGFLDGHLYCTMLAELAGAAGVEILTGHELRGGAPRDAGGWRLVTSRGELHCDCVVVAAGPWAGRAAALLGCAVPLVPQRHQAVVVHLPHELPYTMPSVMDYTPETGAGAGPAGGEGHTAEASRAGGGLYFRHERPGQLIAGLHTEEATAAAADPDGYARGADPEFLEAVAERLVARLPALAAARLGQGWAGLYPVTPDGLPLLGPVPGHPGVFLAGGAGGSGIQLSPVLGELLADWVLAGEPRVVPGARELALDRESLAG